MTPPRLSLRLIVIGASAGAVEALNNLLPLLPENFYTPIAIVVHLPAEKPSLLAEIFQRHSKLSVLEVEDKQLLRDRSIYFAPPDYHLLVEHNGQLSLSNEEPVKYSRPSIDVLFESAADAYREGVIGIILSGANDDGAAGCKMIAEAGGTVLVQDPAEAKSDTMPLAAIEQCPGAKVMTTREIAEYIIGVTKAV